MNFMHSNVIVENVYVRNADNLQLAELAMGDFGGSHNGGVTVRANRFCTVGVNQINFVKGFISTCQKRIVPKAYVYSYSHNLSVSNVRE